MKHATLPIICCCLLLLSPAGAADKPAKPAKKTTRPRRPKIVDTPGLPRVLLIGDSISMGYTVPTRTLLAGKVNLHRIPANGGPTLRGLASIDAWLGKKKWDVIHFNWGLHDLKYMGAGGKLDLKGKQQVPPEAYEKNLRQLVKRLKSTGAKLIWAATTPVPQGAGGRKKGDAAAYNEIAAKIMKANQITINDLYGFALPRLKKIQHPRNVHFSRGGSEALAEQVAASIRKALGLPQPTTKPEKPARKKDK